METKADKSAFPGSSYLNSLSKREYTCIHNGIPETGDEVLDDIIRKGQRMKLASIAMEGMVANPSIMEAVTSSQLINGTAAKRIGAVSVQYADHLISALNSKPNNQD